MVGATLQQQQQQQQQGTMSAPSAEDEALKWNTDCVYFLTSPLACKKGAECEYRHSEYARVNPRDCYYWLNGNCLNPKCAFRHPPLDGLFGTEEEAFAGSFMPPFPTPVVTAIHAPPYPGKAPVQCIYFQKGFCSRGDTCAFLHGPNPAPSKTSQQIKPPPTTDIPPIKPHPSHLKELASVPKAVDPPAIIKPAPKLEIGLRKNGIERNLPISKNILDDIPKYKETNLSPAVNGNPNPSILNGKDPDDFLRESSPGFDVLVDDHNEDQYGRKPNPENEFDYNSVGDMDHETYPDLRDYDSYENIQYAWEQHNRSSSSERMLYSKVDSPEPSDDMDLRYRLSKHRKGNGLRSVVTHVDDRRYRESSISGRLSGRIKLPRRSPDSRVERERGRVRDRIRARDYDREGVNRRGGGRMRRETADDSFAGPKSLVELKGPRKRKQLDGDSEGDGSFEGPMPLSEILKRKRKETKIGSSNNTTVISNDGESKSTAIEKDQNSIAEDEEHEREGGEYYVEGENAEAEEDDDDDDFAKKIGVVLS